MPIIAKRPNGQTYSLDELREFLTPEDIPNVGIHLLKSGQNIYMVPGTEKDFPCGFVTQEGLNEALSCIGAAEAKAIRYIIFHGIGVFRGVRDKVLIDARDVAICFGYKDPDEAIRKYCKSAETCYATTADVCELAAHSRLANARNIHFWFARAIQSGKRAQAIAYGR